MDETSIDISLREKLGEVSAALADAETELDMRTAYVKQFDVKLTDLAATVKTFETIKLNMQEKLLQAKEELDDVKVLCWPYPFHYIRLLEYSMQILMI